MSLHIILYGWGKKKRGSAWTECRWFSRRNNKSERFLVYDGDKKGKRGKKKRFVGDRRGTTTLYRGKKKAGKERERSSLRDSASFQLRKRKEEGGKKKSGRRKRRFFGRVAVEAWRLRKEGAWKAKKKGEITESFIVCPGEEMYYFLAREGGGRREGRELSSFLLSSH